MIYEVTVNMDVMDGLVIGACCCVKQIKRTQHNADRPSIIWVQFHGESTGRNRRLMYRHLRGNDMQHAWASIFDTQRTFLFNKKYYIRF